uniref:Uncharacterized protein n=1 Tax=viral metagenome TaxID=1070528 RepID=A0A6M3INZ5_9ZZZZ
MPRKRSKPAETSGTAPPPVSGDGNRRPPPGLDEAFEDPRVRIRRKLEENNTYNRFITEDGTVIACLPYSPEYLGGRSGTRAAPSPPVEDVSEETRLRANFESAENADVEDGLVRKAVVVASERVAKIAWLKRRGYL